MKGKKGWAVCVTSYTGEEGHAERRERNVHTMNPTDGGCHSVPYLVQEGKHLTLSSSGSLSALTASFGQLLERTQRSGLAS